MMKRIRMPLAAVILAAMAVGLGAPALAAETEDAVWDGTAAIAFDAGLGTEDSPYQIRDGRQLAYLAKRVNEGQDYGDRYFVLTADIDLNLLLWTPIGSYADDCGFAGTFDGGGHKIMGLATDGGADGQGLFGYVDGGTVRNLQISGATVTGARNVGAIVGVLAGTLEASTSSAQVTGTRYVGGLAGTVLSGGLIQNAYNTGGVTGDRDVGGVAGQLSGEMAAVFNTGQVTGDSRVGGLAGSATSGNCSAGYYLADAVLSGNDIGEPVGAGDLAADKLVTALNTRDGTAASRKMWISSGDQGAEHPLLTWRFVDPDGWVNPYADVDHTHWYYDAVKAVTNAGLFSGTDEGTFAPDETMTRPMFVAVLGRLAEEEGIRVTGYTHSFADVPEDAWYADYVAWAASAGIVSGQSETWFGADAPVTREEMATLLVRYADLSGVELPEAGYTAFTDSGDLSAWAVEPVARAAAAELLSGYPDGTFLPGETASRAEVANLFYGFCALYR